MMCDCVCVCVCLYVCSAVRLSCCVSAVSSMEFESFDMNSEADDNAITVCSRDDQPAAADAGRPVLCLMLYSLCSRVCCIVPCF